MKILNKEMIIILYYLLLLVFTFLRYVDLCVFLHTAMFLHLVYKVHHVDSENNRKLLILYLICILIHFVIDFLYHLTGFSYLILVMVANILINAHLMNMLYRLKEIKNNESRIYYFPYLGYSKENREKFYS